MCDLAFFAEVGTNFDGKISINPNGMVGCSAGALNRLNFGMGCFLGFCNLSRRPPWPASRRGATKMQWGRSGSIAKFIRQAA